MFTNTVKKLIGIIVVLLVLVGCATTNTPINDTLADGGTLYVKVNPEIAVHYDEEGLVTRVNGTNDDGKELVVNENAYNGLAANEAVVKIIEEIDNAGYFVDEIEGTPKQIVIELEEGSSLPNEQFLNKIATEVQTFVSNRSIKSGLKLFDKSDFTDYDGIDTDYDDTDTDYTDYDGIDTDYTDYDGVDTDYDNDDTDYGAVDTDYDDDSNYDDDSDYDDDDSDYDDSDYRN